MFKELDALYGKLKSARALFHESARRLSEDFMIGYTYHLRMLINCSGECNK